MGNASWKAMLIQSTFRGSKGFDNLTTLPRPMKDSVVRARVLLILDQRRGEDFLPFGAAEQAVTPPQGINEGDWLRALAQLAEYGLIDWRPVEDKRGGGRMGGFARINDLGTRVLNRTENAPINIALDEAFRSRQLQPLQATPAQQEIAEALEKVISAIADAQASGEEKANALSLVWKLLESKAGAAALGGAAQLLLAKYFTE